MKANTAPAKTDQSNPITYITEQVRALNQRENEVKQRLNEAKSELDTINEQRRLVRDKAEEIVQALTPKRQRRSKQADKPTESMFSGLTA